MQQAEPVVSSCSSAAAEEKKRLIVVERDFHSWGSARSPRLLQVLRRRGGLVVVGLHIKRGNEAILHLLSKSSSFSPRHQDRQALCLVRSVFFTLCHQN